MIFKVLIIFDPELNLFKSYAYTFMQQSHFNNKTITLTVTEFIIILLKIF